MVHLVMLLTRELFPLLIFMYLIFLWSLSYLWICYLLVKELIWTASLDLMIYPVLFRIVAVGELLGMVIGVEILLTSMSWTPCIFLLLLLLLVCHHQHHLLANGIIVLDIYVDLVCPPLFIKDVWGMFLLSLLFTAKGCKLGKQVQLPYYSSTSHSAKPFDLIHLDVWGLHHWDKGWS
jgi:hypothetical protein